MNYYDLVLGLIPLALLGLTALFTTVAGFSLTTAVPVAGSVSAAMIGHAMFVRTPTDAGSDAVAPAVVAE